MKTNDFKQDDDKCGCYPVDSILRKESFQNMLRKEIFHSVDHADRADCLHLTNANRKLLRTMPRCLRLFERRIHCPV